MGVVGTGVVPKEGTAVKGREEIREREETVGCR